MKLILLYQIFFVFTQQIKIKNQERSNSFISESQQSSNIQPSLEEYETNIYLQLINGLPTDQLSENPENQIGAFEAAFQFNKNFKCNFGKNIHFSTNAYLTAVQTQIQQTEKYISKFNPNNIILHFNELTQNIEEILQEGENIYCNKQIKNMTIRIDRKINDLTLNLHKIHQNIFESLYDFLFNFLKEQFPQDLKIVSPTYNDYALQANQFWVQNLQDSEKIQKYINENLEMSSRLLSQKNNQILSENIGTIFGKLLESIVKYKLVIEGDSDMLLAKRYGSALYDRFKTIITYIQYFWTQVLILNDKDRDIEFVKKFVILISQTFAVGNSWFLIFKDENYAGTIKTIDNFAEKDIYELAGNINNQQRTCSALSEMQEIFNFFPQPDSPEPVDPFQLNQYAVPISTLNLKLCKKHPQSCLLSLLNPVNSRQLTMMVKLHPTIIEQLSTPLLYGPITQIQIVQNAIQKEDFIIEGYKALYEFGDFGIFYARQQNRDISKVSFQPGLIEDYKMEQNVINYMIIQIYENIVMMAESNSKEKPVTGIYYGDWAPQNYTLLSDKYWISYEDHTPKKQLSKGQILVTDNSLDCKKELSEKQIGFIEVISEKSEDKLMVWFYRPVEAYLLNEISNFVKNETKCQLVTNFEVDTGCHYELISEKMKQSIEKRQLNKEEKVQFIEFIKIPTFEYQLLKIRYKHQLTQNQIDSFKLSDVAPLISPKHTTYQKYKNALCQNNCVYLETGYEQFLNNLVGQSIFFPSKSSKYNYTQKPAMTTNYDCNELYKTIPGLKTPRMANANNLITNFQVSKTHQILQDMAHGFCDFSKVYKIEFSCVKKLKFLYSKDNQLIEVIGQFRFALMMYLNKIQNISRYLLVVGFPYKVNITWSYKWGILKSNKIQKTQKIMGIITLLIGQNSKINKSQITKGKILIFSKLNNLRFLLYARIDYKNFNFIGLPDSYSGYEDCIKTQNHYKRLNFGESKFNQESFNFKIQNSLKYAQQPLRLKYVLEEQIAKIENELETTKCHFGRIFFPIQWQGSELDSCNENISCNLFNSVKSLKYLPQTKGIYESCDGTKLTIGEVYFLEYLYYSDSTLQEFKNPTDLEINIAKKHGNFNKSGFIPFNNQSQYYKQIHGYDVKIRFWVKPNPQINTYKRIVCNYTDVEEEEQKINQQQQDIYTRVVLESEQQ